MINGRTKTAPALAALAAFATVFCLSGCRSIKVDPVSPNFQSFATGYAPIAVADNEDGSLAEDLGERLGSGKAAMTIVDSARYKLTAELIEDNTKRTVEHDTEKRTVRRRNRQGQVVSSYQRIVRWETTSVTTRYIEMEYRLEDETTGEVLWSASTRRSAHEDHTRSSSYRYPAPPRHPEPPPLMKLVDRANESASRQLGKAVQKAIKQSAKAAKRAQAAEPPVTTQPQTGSIP